MILRLGIEICNFKKKEVIIAMEILKKPKAIHFDRKKGKVILMSLKGQNDV